MDPDNNYEEVSPFLMLTLQCILEHRDFQKVESIMEEHLSRLSLTSVIKY